MTKMVRKQVYIEPRQEELLKQWAEETAKTEAEILRQALDSWIASEEQRREAQAAWEAERDFIASRMAEGDTVPGRGWTRKDLYEERLSRYGRDAD